MMMKAGAFAGCIAVNSLGRTGMDVGYMDLHKSD